MKYINGKKTQKTRVLEILKAQGFIDNFATVESKLTLRLGAVINVLRAEGVEFDDNKSGYLSGTKNWRYYLKDWTPPIKSYYRNPVNNELVEIK